MYAYRGAGGPPAAARLLPLLPEGGHPGPERQEGAF